LTKGNLPSREESLLFSNLSNLSRRRDSLLESLLFSSLLFSSLEKRREEKRREEKRREEKRREEKKRLGHREIQIKNQARDLWHLWLLMLKARKNKIKNAKAKALKPRFNA